jgi:hypothetical protein
MVDERPLPLAIAAIWTLLVPHGHAAAWRSVLAALRPKLPYLEAWTCYGTGSLANTMLPAKLGEPVRIELFARRLTGSHPRSSSERF